MQQSVTFPLNDKKKSSRYILLLIFSSTLHTVFLSLYSIYLFSNIKLLQAHIIQEEEKVIMHICYVYILQVVTAFFIIFARYHIYTILLRLVSTLL